MRRNEYYFQIVVLWSFLFILSLYLTVRVLVDAAGISGNLFFLMLFLIGLFHFFILNLIKDATFLYTWKKVKRPVKKKIVLRAKPKVEIIYLTGNSFNATVLKNSLIQDYSNYQVTLLDRSTKPRAKAKISLFTNKYKIKRVRFEEHQSEAECINSYLRLSKAPFFVLLNDKGSIDSSYIKTALPYFVTKKLAVLQPHFQYISGIRDGKRQLSLGRIGKTNVFQLMRESFGFLPAGGAGIMIRRAAYIKTSGIHSLESENIPFSLMLKKKRYSIRYAEDLQYERVNNESHTFSLRSLIILMTRVREIYHSKINWYEKLDLLLFLHQFSLKTVLISYYLLFLSMHFLLHFTLHYTIKMELSYLIVLSLPMLAYAESLYLLHEKRIKRITKSGVAIGKAFLKNRYPSIDFSLIHVSLKRIYS